MRTELTDRFSEAVDEARVLHMGDVRKGTQIPYFSHLLAVASLVLDDGGSEDEAIAAILHDALEDNPGDAAQVLRLQIGHSLGSQVLGVIDIHKNTPGAVKGIPQRSVRGPAGGSTTASTWRVAT